MGASGANAAPQPWSDDFKPSLLSLLSKNQKLLAAIDQIPPDLHGKSEMLLERQIRSENKFGKFPRLLGILKIAFWDEYRRAHLEKTFMRMENVYYGVSTPQYWSTTVLCNPLYLAWLIHPPGDEMLLQKELLGLGFKKLREAMEAPLYDVTYKNLKEEQDDGTTKTVVKEIKTFNVALVREIHALVKTLQDRIHGAVIQKQQIASVAAVNVQMNTTQKSPDQINLSDPNLSLEDLEKFESKLKGIAASISSEVPEEASDNIIEVTPVESEYVEP